MSGPAVQDCLVCGTPGARVTYDVANDNYFVTCIACGNFCLDGFVQNVGGVGSFTKFWTAARRSALSHLIRTRRNLPMYGPREDRPYVSRDELDRLEKENIRLPNRLVQADNLIRWLGNVESEHGDTNGVSPKEAWSIVGAAGEDSYKTLVTDMISAGVIMRDETRGNVPGSPVMWQSTPRLSLEGWKRWREIHEGDTRSTDGFIAMQFGDPRLDVFVRNVIQAGIQDRLGLKIHRIDSPDRVQAGLIDNIMREAIEDAAFVLVELSHGNRGAYWEAGFAEGLGKPVIYLCEQAVWNDPPPDKKVHFDVNHRTTVMWDEAQPELFLEKLVATIKNSLRRDSRGKEKAG